LTNQVYSTGQVVTIDAIPFVCFLRGTLIRTSKGDVAVENLKEGDLIIASSGERRLVRWVGHRDIDLRGLPDAHLFYLVRIATHAFGPNRPSKDLYVSSGHSICVDLCGEVLIPAGRLINGSTIEQVAMDEVSYWHVELESHDILLANTLPAESYLVMENRSFFEEAGATLDSLDEGLGRTHADFCRPVVLDGSVLEFVLQRLTERAEALGWTASRETNLHLLVDGEVRRPLEEGETAAFLFPAEARDVRLMSNTFVPAALGYERDPRELGLKLHALSFCGRSSEPISVSLDDKRLMDGFYAEEGESGAAWRWTKGELVLSREFWSAFAGQVALVVAHDGAAIRRWIPPAAGRHEASLDEKKPKLRVAA
jgi:hypothetical protein